MLLISYYIKITSGLYDLQPEVTWFYFTLYLTFIYLPRLLLQFLLQVLIFPTALLRSACYRSRKKTTRNLENNDHSCYSWQAGSIADVWSNRAYGHWKAHPIWYAKRNVLSSDIAYGGRVFWKSQRYEKRTWWKNDRRNSQTIFSSFKIPKDAFTPNIKNFPINQIMHIANNNDNIFYSFWLLLWFESFIFLIVYLI